jgi:Tfp pilus assembly protein PilZ
VEVVIDTPTDTVTRTATTLGAGGLFVATNDLLETHTPVFVRFRLPGDDRELSFQAHVAWRRPAGAGASGMGLAFDDPEARADLAARLEAWAELREAARSGTDDV